MLKQLSLCAALIAFAAGPVAAQQREAALTRVPGAAFDILVAMPRPQGATYDFGKSPEALLIPLIGGELALGFDDEEKMLKAFDSLGQPMCAFHVEGGESRKPVAVYIAARGKARVVPAHEAALISLSPNVSNLTSVGAKENAAQHGKTLTMSLTRMKPSPAEFDIVFGITKFPGTGRLVFKHDGEGEEMLTAIVPMLSPKCVTHVEHNDGSADVISVYVVPKEGGLGPPMQ